MKETLRLKLVRQKSDPASSKRRKVWFPKRTQSRIARKPYGQFLSQAGIEISAFLWVCVIATWSVLLSALVYRFLGMVPALAVGAFVFYYLFHSYPTLRAERRRRKVLLHLPAFIDTVVASLRAGCHLELALEQSAQGLPEGILKAEWLSALEVMRHRMSLDDALGRLPRRIAGREMIALVLTLRMFSGRGGRVVEPLKKLGTKMRTQQALAERLGTTLIGTQQAFFVVAGLSIAAFLFLMIFHRGYLVSSFDDPVLRYIFQVAVLVQVLCMVLFTNIANPRV